MQSTTRRISTTIKAKFIIEIQYKTLGKQGWYAAKNKVISKFSGEAEPPKWTKILTRGSAPLIPLEITNGYTNTLPFEGGWC